MHLFPVQICAKLCLYTNLICLSFATLIFFFVTLQVWYPLNDLIHAWDEMVQVVQRNALDKRVSDEEAKGRECNEEAVNKGNVNELKINEEETNKDKQYFEIWHNSNNENFSKRGSNKNTKRKVNNNKNKISPRLNTGTRSVQMDDVWYNADKQKENLNTDLTHKDILRVKRKRAHVLDKLTNTNSFGKMIDVDDSFASNYVILPAVLHKLRHYFLTAQKQEMSNIDFGESTISHSLQERLTSSTDQKSVNDELTFQHDLVDVTREVLQVGWDTYKSFLVSKCLNY